MERRRVALIRGDGTGPELVDSMLNVVNSVGVDLDLIPCPAGLEWWENNGGPSFIPEETWHNLENSDACFKGPYLNQVRLGVWLSASDRNMIFMLMFDR